jgi:hypothetical protein
MPHAAQDASPKTAGICAHDLVQIARGADILAGGWIVDPVADIRKVNAPRVWVHPPGQNPLGISFGFSKRGGGEFRVLVRHHDEPNDVVRAEIQYGDLKTAFSKLQSLVIILLDERQDWIPLLGPSVDETIELCDSRP